MGTKNEPGKFDCYANAEPDEPMFVLLGRDITAPSLVRAWAFQRCIAIDNGTRPESDRPMAHEALKCAEHMEAWRARRK